MSTPPNNRDARREARKANLDSMREARRAALQQSAEGAAPDDTEVEEETKPTVTAPHVESATPDVPVAEEPLEIVVDIPAEAPAPIEVIPEPPLEEVPEPPVAEIVVSAVAEIDIPELPATAMPEPPQAAQSAKSDVPVGKTPTRPVTSSAARSSKTPTRPGASTAKPAGKTPTRPITPSPKVAGSSVPTSKTPSRPVTSSAKPAGTGASRSTSPSTGNDAASAPSVAAFQARGTVTADDAIRAKRDTRREARLAAITRDREERKRQLQLKKRNAAITRYAIIAAVIVGVALIIALIAHAVAGSGATTPARAYGANITCDTSSQGNTPRTYANVQIYVNGKNEAIPADAGVAKNSAGAQCMYWLNTQDATGVIHITPPSGDGPFKLGDFFAVWAKTPANTIAAGPPALTKTSFFGLKIDAAHPLTVYINGVKFTGDPATIVLKANENIWLEYGAPLVSPTPYSWPTGE